VVPAVFKDRCIAAAKLVTYGDLDEAEFEGWVDHLDVLVQAFMQREAAWLSSVMSDAPEDVADAPPEAVPPDKTPQSRRDRRLGGLLRYIETNLTDRGAKLSVKGIADRLEVNPVYLSDWFHRQVGVRLSWYIAAQRMERAKDLLHQPLAQIKDVAPAVGYNNSRAFSQAFGAHTGITPRAFRRSARSA
jgi:AraC-like DNA-binding protein